jgi:hypothetical protein
MSQRNQEKLEQLMAERWQSLKTRAQNERNAEKLMKILEEIDDLLFNVEMIVAVEYGQGHAIDHNDA